MKIKVLNIRMYYFGINILKNIESCLKIHFWKIVFWDWIYK